MLQVVLNLEVDTDLQSPDDVVNHIDIESGIVKVKIPKGLL